MSEAKQTLMDILGAARGWVRREPVGTFLILIIIAALGYFFGFLRLFSSQSASTAVWAWKAWSPDTNYEHARIIPLVVAFLIWHSRDKLRQCQTSSSHWGWWFIGLGVFLFVAGARTVQARISLTALPFLLFGVVLYVWGPKVARVLLFPIAFLFFMVPLNFLAQATVKLQFIETNVASAICNLLGVGVFAVGTAVHATNGAFQFEVDEGCSGIRSLMAIAMLSAIYGHLTQDRLWKKLALFAAALLFAVIGNAGRLVSIFLVARWFGQDLAGGPYHSISGFLSFPFALAAMFLFGKLLNLRISYWKHLRVTKESVSYDY